MSTAGVGSTTVTAFSPHFDFRGLIFMVIINNKKLTPIPTTPKGLALRQEEALDLLALVSFVAWMASALLSAALGTVRSRMVQVLKFNKHSAAPAVAKTVSTANAPEMQKVVDRCPSLAANGFAPARAFPTGDLATLAVALRPAARMPDNSSKQLEFQRHSLVVGNGTIILDTVPGRDVQDATKGVVLVLHGLTGGSQESYMQHCISELARAGYTPVAYNARGCGGAPESGTQASRPMCAAFADDVAAAVEVVHTSVASGLSLEAVIASGAHASPATGRHEAPIFAVGFSMGAVGLSNFLARYPFAPVAGAVTVGSSWCAAETTNHIEESWFKRFTWNRMLTAAVRQYYLSNLDAIRSSGWWDEEAHAHIMGCRTMRAIDHHFVAKAWGYDDGAQYYRDASARDKVRTGQVRVPLLVLHADDDPICPATGVPVDAPERASNVIVSVTRGGGHLGWCEEPDATTGFFSSLAPRLSDPSWCDRAIREFLDACAHEQQERGSHWWEATEVPDAYAEEGVEPAYSTASDSSSAASSADESNASRVMCPRLLLHASAEQLQDDSHTPHGHVPVPAWAHPALRQASADPPLNSPHDEHLERSPTRKLWSDAAAAVGE